MEFRRAAPREAHPVAGDTRNPTTLAGAAPSCILRPIPPVKIEHLALWTPRLEALRDFYVRHFGCTVAPLYQSSSRTFRSQFLAFADGARLELMEIPALQPPSGEPERTGLVHFAVSVGSEERVRHFTDELRAAGVRVLGEPRRTGDGYFESVVLDPDGNRIEITI